MNTAVGFRSGKAARAWHSRVRRSSVSHMILAIYVGLAKVFTCFITMDTNKQ
jgi:hypothetical protein